MNYTNKYHLPQWEKSDRILMDDFNQMCLDMEAGLEKNLQDASDATSAAAGNAAAAAAKAQETADNALAAADAARTIANNAFSPSRLPFVTGSYTGNGSTQAISLGFQPRFLIISRQHTTTGPSGGDIVASRPGDKLGQALQWSSTGFQVVFLSTTSSIYPSVNESGSTYHYIAFR